MYAMVATKFDLAFIISVVSRFMLKPGPMHWMAIKRIMRYLKGTIDMKLRIGGQHIGIKGYSDADWAGDVTTVGLPPDTFSLLEREPFCGIANDNKRWYNLQWRQNTWP